MKANTNVRILVFLKPSLLTVVALLVFILGYFPAWVEESYSTGIYPAIGNTLRMITRHIPFSLGDILYGWIFIWLIISSIKAVLSWRRHGFSRERFLLGSLRWYCRILSMYILFKLLWGLNYSRLGLAAQFKLPRNEYSKTDVINLTNRLIDSLNSCRARIPDTSLPSPPTDSLYRLIYRGYDRLSIPYPFLGYTNRSVKTSLYSFLADYGGYTGYYNPFTGEAQVRSNMPRVMVPYVAAHEMAHQLGYASESEANFIGYLATLHSGDAYSRYSAYLELFSYAQQEEIYQFALDQDSTGLMQQMQANKTRLDTLVKKDRREIRAFFAQRRNRIAPAISGLYDQYLRINQQEKGIRSYDEVIGWLIAYHQRYESRQ